jgi:hypothetical protein
VINLRPQMHLLLLRFASTWLFEWKEHILNQNSSHLMENHVVDFDSVILCWSHVNIWTLFFWKLKFS